MTRQIKRNKLLFLLLQCEWSSDCTRAWIVGITSKEVAAHKEDHDVEGSFIYMFVCLIFALR